jgi:RNA polymerase sigma-70 factor (ECF subfamily)
MFPTSLGPADGNYSPPRPHLRRARLELGVTSEEIRLIERARRGDQLALGAVLRRQEHRLFASALVILRSSWDAEDAVQETLCEVCASLQALRDPEKFGAWLSTILVRKCYRMLSSARPSMSTDGLPDEAQAFVGAERDDEVLRAVATLPEEQRVAIALRYFLDLTYRDIQIATGWPSGTVKSRINRGMKELRMTLSERRIGDGL